MLFNIPIEAFIEISGQDHPKIYVEMQSYWNRQNNFEKIVKGFIFS